MGKHGRNKSAQLYSYKYIKIKKVIKIILIYIRKKRVKYISCVDYDTHTKKYDNLTVEGQNFG